MKRADGTCSTCTRPVESPYRRIVDGHIVEGCIDACHGEHLTPTTNSYAWHFRRAAKAFRKAR